MINHDRVVYEMFIIGSSGFKSGRSGIPHPILHCHKVITTWDDDANLFFVILGVSSSESKYESIKIQFFSCELSFILGSGTKNRFGFAIYACEITSTITNGADLIFKYFFDRFQLLDGSKTKISCAWCVVGKLWEKTQAGEECKNSFLKTSRRRFSSRTPPRTVVAACELALLSVSPLTRSNERRR